MTNLANYLYKLRHAERWACNNASDVDFRHGGVEIMTKNYMKDPKKNKEDKTYDETKSSRL